MRTISFKGNICSHEHSWALDNFLRRLFQSPKKIVGPYIKVGDTVMDLGCGPGFFTIEMAKMVGSPGNVIGVDLQKEMLAIVARKLSNTELEQRVTLHRCSEYSFEFEQTMEADFILAYYVIHETSDYESFLREAKTQLKKYGKFLIVEPLFHVGRKQFQKITHAAEKVGFSIVDKPRHKGGRSLLLTH